MEGCACRRKVRGSQIVAASPRDSADQRGHSLDGALQGALNGAASGCGVGFSGLELELYKYSAEWPDKSIIAIGDRRTDD